MGLAAGLAGAMPVKSGQVHLNFGIAMSQPNGDYAYWESPPQDIVYPMPMQASTVNAKEEALMETMQAIQRSLSSNKRLPPEQPAQPQSAIAVPGSGLSLIIETDTARLRIAFEPK